MAKIVIYTKDYCPYCTAAKALLRKKNAQFEEIDILVHPEKRDEMVALSSGRTSVPQIFINGKHYGGSDDLHGLDARGGLDPLLKE